MTYQRQQRFLKSADCAKETFEIKLKTEFQKSIYCFAKEAPLQESRFSLVVTKLNRTKVESSLSYSTFTSKCLQERESLISFHQAPTEI